MPKAEELELVIIGGGPAGLTAAIYAARCRLKAVLLEEKVVGGQVKSSYSIDNYPGYKGDGGFRLAEQMEEQALGLGVRIEEFESVEQVNLQDRVKLVQSTSMSFSTLAVIIATGASPRRLTIPSESVYAGKGIHYCAVCDGAMYEDKVVAVVGGGNSALIEALYLAKLAAKVIIIRRKSSFHGERALISEVEGNPKVEVLYNHDLVDVNGSGVVEEAVIRNTLSGDLSYVPLSAIFGYIGVEPKTSVFRDTIHLDDDGYIITDENMRTNISGVYAAGDVRVKRFRQITTAVADGTIAALDAEGYITNINRG